MFIVADAHERAASPKRAEFFQMLDAFRQTGEDVVFLGDIMDLWIALPRYEDDEQAAFIQWCRDMKALGRKVYFVEGNHEFYVAARYADAFAQSNEGELTLDGVKFVHGNMVQGRPLSLNRLYIGLVKSAFGHFFLRWMPFGPSFANWMKRLTGHRKNARSFLPEQDIRRFMQSQDVAAVLCLGHFHTEGHFCAENGRPCHALPAWKDRGRIARLGADGLVVDYWKDLVRPERR